MQHICQYREKLRAEDAGIASIRWQARAIIIVLMMVRRECPRAIISTDTATHHAMAKLPPLSSIVKVSRFDANKCTGIATKIGATDIATQRTIFVRTGSLARRGLACLLLTAWGATGVSYGFRLAIGRQGVIGKTSVLQLCIRELRLRQQFCR